MAVKIRALLLMILAVCCTISAWSADSPKSRDHAWHKGKVEDLIERLLPEFAMADGLLEKDEVEWIRKHQPTARFGYACGHFRDDAHLDCAALVRKKSDKKRARRVVVLQDVLADSPKVVEVFSLEDYPHQGIYLDNLPQGEIPDVSELQTIHIPREGFHLFFSKRVPLLFSMRTNIGCTSTPVIDTNVLGGPVSTFADRAACLPRKRAVQCVQCACSSTTLKAACPRP